MKTKISERFRMRIEKLMGSALVEQDNAFLEEDLPLVELEQLKVFSEKDSTTLNKEGVQSLQDLVAADLEELGFQIEWLKGETRFADLLYATRPGRRKDRFITLITHTDTVLPITRGFHLDPVEGLARGSGVIDNKGGVIVGLSALRRFLKHQPQTEFSIRFVCSPNEELGSIGFIDFFRQLAKDTEVGFGLEPALDNGSIIHARRGNRWYDIEVLGKEAHAGRSYGHHANAAHDLAKKIVELASLTNYRKHNAVNVGHIEAGRDKYNVICGFARAKLDVRFASFEAREGLHRKIEKILEPSLEMSVDGLFKSTTSYKLVDDCPPFTLTRQSKRLARSYAALVSQIEGQKISSQPSGGAGDVNYLSTESNFILDGLGPVGGEMHTPAEFVRTATLKTRARALAGFLKHLQVERPRAN